MYTNFKKLLNKHFSKSFSNEISEKISGADLIIFYKEADKYSQKQISKLKKEFKENYILSQVYEKLKTTKNKNG